MRCLTKRLVYCSTGVINFVHPLLGNANINNGTMKIFTMWGSVSVPFINFALLKVEHRQMAVGRVY